MRAKFIAKSDYYNCDYKFSVGEYYELTPQGDDFYSTIDNNGEYAYFKNGVGYKFDIPKPELNERDMTYRMNGAEVTKKFFEDNLAEVEELKSKGV